MVEDEAVEPLREGALMRLFDFMSRGEVGIVGRNTPPGVAQRVLQKLNDDAVAGDFAPLELRFLSAVRRYGDTRDEAGRLRKSYPWAVERWGEQNSELIKAGTSRVINDHLRAQADAVAGLTDQEIGTIRRQVEVEASHVFRRVVTELARADEISSDGTILDVIGALRARACGLQTSSVLGIVVATHSRHQLELPTLAVSDSAPLDEDGLRPLAVRLIEIRDLEALLPDLGREAEIAFEALNAASAADRWDAAGT